MAGDALADQTDGERLHPFPFNQVGEKFLVVSEQRRLDFGDALPGKQIRVGGTVILCHCECKEKHRSSASSYLYARAHIRVGGNRFLPVVSIFSNLKKKELKTYKLRFVSIEDGQIKFC